MRRLLRYTVLLALAGLLAACGGAPDTGNKPALALAPCQLAAPGVADRVAAKCATLTVFEDRAAQRGRTIDLYIAVIPAISRSPAADPLFLLSGGPGQAAGETYPQLAPAFTQINQNRDI